MSEHRPVPTFRGRIENGKIRLVERDKFAHLIDNFEGNEIVISLKKFRRGRSTAQNAYYWGVVVKVFADFCGYGEEDHDGLHETFKAKFLMRHTDWPVPVVGSTTTLDTAQFTEYIENVRRFCAEYGCPIPDPGEY